MDVNTINSLLAHTTIIGFVVMKALDWYIKKAKWTPATETFELVLDLVSSLAAKAAAALRAQLPAPDAQDAAASSTNLDTAAQAMGEVLK